jgi:hypothetical protein
MGLWCSRQRVGTRIAVALAVLSASPATAHDPVRFDTRRSMPGASLTIVEVSRAEVPAATVRYRLHAVGVPRGLVVEVWANEFGHGYHQLLADLQADESGTVVSTEPDGTGRPRRLDELVFEPGPLVRGAGWEVAIVGRDRKVVAYAKVIPHPIIGREGPCEVSLELASHRGERFIVSGTGFVPGEDVLTELKYSGGVIRKTRHALADGRLPQEVIVHGTGARPSETSRRDRLSRYLVRGRLCEVVVEYEWGQQVLGDRSHQQ